MLEVFGPDGLIANAHPEYEYRPGQIDMARAVMRAFEEKRHLIVEAGTGTGKTLAYLVPAVAAALGGNGRVIVSTGTKNLQEQLMEKDRRSAPRVRVKLQARWEGVLSRETATLTDLSRSGCFVLTGGKVETKELVWLEIQLTDQQKVNFWAEVVDQASEIGFALKFNSSSPEDEGVLAKYLEGLFQSQGQKNA